MAVGVQLVGVTLVPLNCTVLVPCVNPKFVPVIASKEPTVPEVGFKLVILGALEVTVKGMPLLATPPTVTTTFPVVAPTGTGTVMLDGVQLVGVELVPLNRTVFAPCADPKFTPVMVIDEPTVPELGFKLVILGALEVTVNIMPLLGMPPTVTTIFPVVAPDGTCAVMLEAFQILGDAVVPLKLTELAPCVAPKFVPVRVTGVPGTPDVGLEPVILGFVPPPEVAALKAIA